MNSDNEGLEQSHQRYRRILDFVPYPMVVSRLDGRVFYVNSSFTDLFGWQLSEIRDQLNPFIPIELQREAADRSAQLEREGEIDQYVTQRITRNGQRRTVAIKTKLFMETAGGPSVSHEIIRDVTHEILESEQREAILRISQALPEYPDLEELLDFISGEINRLIGTEGAAVILLDEEKQELYIPGAAYDESGKKRRVKEVRYALDELFAGEVIKTREPVIVHDTSKTDRPYPARDKKFGYHTKNFLLVPLRSDERVIGVLCAINIKQGQFDQGHVDLLTMIAGTVALTIENARANNELKRAYREVSRLNRAKDKAIQHLSHELRTPLSILNGSIGALKSRLEALPAAQWEKTFDRISRNLRRISQINEAVEDIMGDQENPYLRSTTAMLKISEEVIESAMAAEGLNAKPVMEALRAKLKSYFSADDDPPAVVAADRFVQNRLAVLEAEFSHRNLDIRTHLSASPVIRVPETCLRKCVDGLLRNAIENTPDEGRIDVWVDPMEGGCRIEIADLGVGITPESREMIFGGFFATQKTLSYSSKRPFDFNAGGKGMDLLRMKIFSERYGFLLAMDSVRCRFIPTDADLCPGRISLCQFCTTPADCRASGFSRFSLYFPSAPRIPSKSIDHADEASGTL